MFLRSAVLRQRLWQRVGCVVLCCVCGALVASAQRAERKPASGKRPRTVGAAPTPQPTPTPAASTEAAEPDEPPLDADDVVRVNTQLVSVPTLVTDQNGRPLVNLAASDFTLYEDGKPQKISAFATTETPFEVALLLDTSGSTRADLKLIQQAAQNFINSLRAGDRVALIAFSRPGTDSTQLANVDILTTLTAERDSLDEALATLGASNGTPYYDSLTRILQDVFREPPAPEARGRRAIVALTDGVDSASDMDFAFVRAQLLKVGVACYFVQVNTEDFVEERLLKDCEETGALRLSRAQLARYSKIAQADARDYANYCRLGQFDRMQISRQLYTLARQEMNELAKATGGNVFPIDDLRSARAALTQVAAELGTQYNLGYYSANAARDGKYRKIRVEVRGVKDAQIRAREGYVAAK